VVPPNQPFATTLVAQPGMTDSGYPQLGARVVTPGVEAIVSAWRQASLSGSVFTVTLDGPTTPGSYQVNWITTDEPPTFNELVPLWCATGVDTASQVDTPASWPPVPVDDIQPTVYSVAQLLRTRTVDQYGTDQETFNDSTRPTEAEAIPLIWEASKAVMAQMRVAVSPDRYDDISQLVRFYAAYLIEVSYYREEPVQRADVWLSMYNSSLAALNAQIESDLQIYQQFDGMEAWRPPPPGLWSWL